MKLLVRKELTGQIRQIRQIRLFYTHEGIFMSHLNEDAQPLKIPNIPCPHCGATQFVIWDHAHKPGMRAISCNGCGAVLSSTHPLDPDDRPKRRY